jgi:NitT/TauT family transport system substrate-binding protein
MNKGILRFGIAIAAIAIIAIGFYIYQNSVEPEITDVTLMIGFTPNVGYAPYYVAKARGFYEAEGLNVEFIYNPDGIGAVMDLLGAGQVEFGYGGDSGVIDSARENIPVVVVQKIIQENLFRLVVKNDSGISSPADLVGKTIAFSGPTGGDTQVAKIILHESGVSFDQIEPRYVGAQTISTFVQGQVDSLGAYLPQQVIADNLLGETENTIAFAGSDYTTLGTTYTYTSKQLLETNSELVEKFVRATQKGLDYAVKNPSAGVEAFILYNPEAAEGRVLHTGLWDAFAEQGFNRDSNGNIIYGLPSEDQWDKKLSQMLAAGIIDQELDLNGYLKDFDWIKNLVTE